MIILFTDFGLHGPYTGQRKAVLHQTAPGALVIDLFADAPIGNPKASAYLLATYAQWFPAGTCLSPRYLRVLNLAAGSNARQHNLRIL